MIMAKGKVYDTNPSRPHKQGSLESGAAASSGERTHSAGEKTRMAAQVGKPADKGVNR
jgi:hypothetical protein